MSNSGFSKAWFKVEWEGPVMQNGKPTSTVKQQDGVINLNLFNSLRPKTVENFGQLCNGVPGLLKSGEPAGYKGSSFHRIIPQFMLQGGDFTRGNGTGGVSIYGAKFADELLRDKNGEKAVENVHKVGTLSMANAGPDTNGSQFFITTVVTSWLDGGHAVFGEVADKASMDIVFALEATGNRQGEIKYSKRPTIVDCGAE